MRRKISQDDARRFKKRCEELERILAMQKNCWRSEWSYGWVNISNIRLEPSEFAKIATARLLKHAVLVQADSDRSTIKLYADSLEK